MELRFFFLCILSDGGLYLYKVSWKYSGRYLSYRADMIFIGKISKELNFVKMLVELWFFFSAHRLMAVSICTKIHENIIKGIKVLERTRFS